MNAASLATARLRASLDAIAGALSSPDLEGLLAAEHGLASALNELGRIRCVDPSDRSMMCEEIARARTALLRCRIFGSVLDDVTQATLVAQGRGPDYNRNGARPLRGIVGGGRLKARM